MTDPFLSDVDASLYLQQAGTLADEEIDIFECALAFSLLDKPQTDIALYRHYFQKMHKNQCLFNKTNPMSGAAPKKQTKKHKTNDFLILYAKTTVKLMVL